MIRQIPRGGGPVRDPRQSLSSRSCHRHFLFTLLVDDRTEMTEHRNGPPRGAGPTGVRQLLLRKALALMWSRVATNSVYRPEKHYMRGPGPKSLDMIGRRFRAETESITKEPLPERWLALMHTFDEEERKRSRPGQAGEIGGKAGSLE